MSSAARRPKVLIIDEDGPVHRVTMNRPDRLNALDASLSEALLSYFEERRRDRATRVILLTGAGRAFCAGADIKGESDERAADPRPHRDGLDGDWILRDVMRAIRDCPQPVIALVRGPAAGGGLALALACDVILASESALFYPAFLKVGLSGAELGVAWRLQRMIGLSHAREMLLANRSMTAAEALNAGLVSRISPDAELDDHGRDLANDMLAAPDDALRLTKRTLDTALEIGSADASMELEERAQMLMISRMTRSPI
jgi:enoyl-CoA hydratase/carnithine racemase